MPVWCANTSDGSAGILVADPDVPSDPTD